MKNSHIKKIIFYTILVFCISAFSCFPKSYSKYIKEEEPAKFFVGIDKLYIGALQNLSPRTASTYKTVNYILEFDRSQVMKDYDNSQQIFVEIKQSSCKINTISTKGTKSINGNKATITYTSAGTDYIRVNYSCNVEDITVNENNKDIIYTNVYIYEKFMPENKKYLYAKADSIKTLVSEYYKIYPKPISQISADGKTLILPADADNKYNEFIVWLNNYSTILNDSVYNESIIMSYVNTVYNNEEDILNLSNSLKGITVTYDSTTNNYIYNIDDNFAGYARTYSTYIGPKKFIKMVFSNNNLTDSEANEILRYYFETYSGYNPEDIEKVVQFVSNYGSINYITKPNGDGTYNEIIGFTYLPESGEIRISSSLIQYINAQLDKKLTLEFEFAGKNAMFNTYQNSLATTYDFLTEELIQALISDINIYKSITKNNSSVAEKTIYSDYFAVQDPTTKKYVLLNVYSDGVATTCIEIIELDKAESITVTPINADINFSIKVDNQDSIIAKDNVTSIMAKLDTYFKTSYTEEITDELFTSSTTVGNITSVIEDNMITISYTITK